MAAADAVGASVWSTTILIRGIGLRLSLPSTVICTALALYHRFRTGEATAQLDSGLVAMAVIYLASKAEEVRLDYDYLSSVIICFLFLSSFLLPEPCCAYLTSSLLLSTLGFGLTACSCISSTARLRRHALFLDTICRVSLPRWHWHPHPAYTTPRSPLPQFTITTQHPRDLRDVITVGHSCLKPKDA